LGTDRKGERYGIYDIIYFSLIFSALFSTFQPVFEIKSFVFGMIGKR